jgi:hypothetical protein
MIDTFLRRLTRAFASIPSCVSKSRHITIRYKERTLNSPATDEGYGSIEGARLSYVSITAYLRNGRTVEKA